LLLINNSWPLGRAKALAKSLPFDGESERRQAIAEAYRRALCRQPSESEIDKALIFIDSLAATRSSVKPVQTDEETGRRPNSEKFSAVQGVDIGTHAIRLQRSSQFEQFESAVPLERDDDAFTIEAVAQLDTIYPNGTVNTLIHRWDENRSSSGWFLCVTSTGSSYQPRNILFVMNGVDQAGAPKYEVVAADLRVPLGKPVYIAASVSAQGNQQGEVTFYLKDLSDPKAPMQTATVKHSVVGKLNDSSFPVTVGGRRKTGHLWDGQVSRLTISKGYLAENQLFLHEQPVAPERIVDWNFSGRIDGGIPVPNANWIGREVVNPRLDSITDFCHLLFNSNEFLYLY
tara:strand:- start:10964 stop:11995 length:1032 start_codon:yes stop_codon:yes gene_type:complete